MSQAVNIATVLSILGFLVALASFVYARQNADATRIHQVLLHVIMEYRSAEMCLAVRTLWKLRRANPQDEELVQAYEKISADDQTRIDELPASRRLEEERSSLHCQRRHVAHFYYFLAGLYERKIVPAEELFSHWTEVDLRIIPRILIPIEKHLLEESLRPDQNNSLAQFPGLVRLQHLYNDARALATCSLSDG